MAFSDILQFVQLVVLGALLIGLPLRWWLKQRAILRRETQRADHAEATVVALREELEDLKAGLSLVARERLEKLRYGGRPMDNPPPGIQSTYQRTIQLWDTDPYTFPIGWEIVQGKPGVVCASADPESPMWTGNILLTAKTRFGKDTLAFLILWTLCYRNPVDRLRVYYIDGKRSDGGLWANIGLAHNLYEPALGEEDIVTAMRNLRELRIARERQRVALRVTKWSELPSSERPPLAVVFVSELDLLELGCPKDEKLEDWLAKEMSSALASGIMYIIGAQTVSNRNTRWRQQCLTYIAGFQDVEDAIEPNFGMSSKEIERLGGISPLHFPAPGYFTARINRSVVTVRTSRIDLGERIAALNVLPRKPAGIVLPPAHVGEQVSGSRWPIEADLPGSQIPRQDDLPISQELWTRIAAVARDLEMNNSSPSRADVYRIVFANGDMKAKPTGDNYKRIRRVCDSEGLLMPKPSPAPVVEMIDSA